MCFTQSGSLKTKGMSELAPKRNLTNVNKVKNILHQCEYCQMCFTQSGSVKRHMRTHTKEKPCQCEYYQKWFTQSGSLIRHIISEAISDVMINKDIMTDSHFLQLFVVVVQCEKRSKSSSLSFFEILLL